MKIHTTVASWLLNFGVIFLGVAILLHNPVAHADERRALLNHDSNDLEALFEQSAHAHAQSMRMPLASKIALSGYESSVGRFSISLSHETRFRGLDSLSGVRFFLGEVAASRARFGNGSIAVAVASTEPNGTRKLKLYLESNFARRKKRLKSLDLSFVEKDGIFETIEVRRVSRHRTRACGTEHTRSPKMFQEAHPDGLNTLSVREVELRIDGDVEFFSSIPNPVANMATMVAISDAYYRRDLGIGLIATINEAPQNYAAQISYDENFNLDYFSVMPSDFVGDAFFVFTGKTPPSADLKNLAGVANDIGSVCSDKARSKGIVLTRFDSGSLSSFTADTLAHELGHTLSLRHDDSVDPTTGYLMNAGTNVNLTKFVSEFSSQSKAEAANFLATSAACLSIGNDLPDQPLPPTLPPDTTPTDDFQLFAQKAVINGRAVINGYLYNGGEPLAGTELQIVFKPVRKKPKVVFSAITDEFGSVTYFPRKLGKYIVTSTGLENSRSVNIRKLRF